MPYFAVVKHDSKLKTIRFAGIYEFVKYESRPFPDSLLAEARANPHLDIVRQPMAFSADGMSAEPILEEGTADKDIPQSEAEKVVPEIKPKKTTTRRRSTRSKKT